MDDHRRFEELLTLRALGELEPEEERELNRHIEGCPECREEAAALRVVRDGLADASVPPPPHLKDRVMEGLPRRWRRVPSTGILATAAVLAVAVLGVVLYARVLSPQENLVATTSLSATELAPGASGEVRLEETGANTNVRLDVSGLPRLGPGEYYELWFVEGEDRISGGGFTVDEQGRATVTMNAPSMADQYPAVGITREETPGDQRPSPTKVLGGELRKT